MKTDTELQKEHPELYAVARQNGTEAPFKGKYVDEKSDGVYRCAVCDASLFSSDTKFDSKSGWPSFTDPVNKEAVLLIHDTSHGMSRTEVRCKQCNAHLGHVFSDGPTEEGNRFCVNSVSLNLQKSQR